MFVEWLVRMSTLMLLKTVARGRPRNWGCRLPMSGSRLSPDVGGRTRGRHVSWVLSLRKVHPVSRPFFCWGSIPSFFFQIINFSPQLRYNSCVVFRPWPLSCWVIQGSPNISQALASNPSGYRSDPVRYMLRRTFLGICMLRGSCRRCSNLSFSSRGSVRWTRRRFLSRTPWGETNYRLRASGWRWCSWHLDLVWSQGLSFKRKPFPTDDTNWRCSFFHVRKAD